MMPVLVLKLLQNWRIVGVMGLVSLLGIQTARHRMAEVDLAELHAEISQAEADATLQGAQSGADATEALLEAEDEDRDAVVRVVERIRNVCVRDESDSQVPTSPGVDAGRNARTEDDREFVRDLERDIRICSRELNEKRAIVQWLRANGAGG